MRRTIGAWLLLWALLIGAEGLAAAAGPEAALGQELRAQAQVIASFGSRMSGSEGCRRTEAYLLEQFGAAGLKRLTTQEFSLAVPVDLGGALEVNGERFRVFGLWPNLVRTPTTPPEGLRGPLVYAGTGELRAFEGQPAQDAIVLMDFNSQTNWLNAPLLGARAVVFLEPETTSRGEAEKKFLQVPVDVPRYWLPREYGDRARALAQGGASALLRGRMDWQERWVRNVIGLLPGTDPQLSKECIVVQAYYDANSVVPALAQGAESADGLLAFLRLMRALAKQPPKRSVLFVATPGHFQALQGMLHFAQIFGEKGRRPSEEERSRRAAEGRIRGQIADWHRRAADARELMKRADEAEGKQASLVLERLERLATNAEADLRLLQSYADYQFPLFISLDLSSQSRRLGMFFCGWYFEDADLIRFFSPLGRMFGEHADEFARVRGLTKEQVYADGANPVQAISWQDFFAGKVAFDSEMSIRSGRPGITFATVDDARPLLGTPLDRLERVDFENLAAQVSLLEFSLQRFLNHPDLVNTAFKRTHRLKLVDYIFRKKIGGVVLEFQRRKSFLPNTPVPNALVLVQHRFKTMMGVNPNRIQFADERGVFEMSGHTPPIPYVFYPMVEAYKVDPATGAVSYAPDQGPEGDKKYPRDVGGRERTRRPVIVFPCAPIDLYDVLDQRYFQTLQQVFVYDGRTGGEPVSSGTSQPRFAGGAEMPSAVEPAAVVYAIPGSRVKITMAMGLLGVRMVLINADGKHPEGQGFDPLVTPRIVLTPLRAVEDMSVLDEYRLRELWRRGISNSRVDTAHRLAGGALQQAKQELAQRRYEPAMRHVRQAWGYESTAYPDVLGTSKDVVKGVVFYLALLLPFCYFAERLLFGYGDIKKRIAATLVIFFVIFFILRAVHPAFELATNGAIILLAFIVLTLALVVIAIVAGKFNEQLERLKQEITGIHRADVGRVSAAGVAFALGVANMRRRKTRTWLTAATLTLLTFTVLSFTSVQSYTKANRLGVRGKPGYNGILVRDKVWSSLEEPTYPVLATELEEATAVSPRAWVASLNLIRPLNLEIAAASQKRYTVNVALGLSAVEPAVSGIDRTLVAGRWFRRGEREACILPASVAKNLGITAAQVGQVWVRVRGMRLLVVGIANDKRLEAVRDLDGESMLPVDYSALRPEVIQQMQEQSANRFRLGRTGVQGLLQEYTHYNAMRVVIIPYDTAINTSEGTLRSVAARFPEQYNVRAEVERLMQRYALNMYAAVRDRLYLYSSMAMTSLRGVQSLAVPIFIAALIVLNTMLGAVYERVREIGIYSAVGLAPVHVGSLFLAEACVYANIGAIAGYLLGQTLSRLMVAYGVLPGLNLNYSSMAAVAMTAVVALTVLASTVYPARKAASMAVPDIQRRWRLPEPEGDWIRVKMPFTVSGTDGRAVMMFLVEFFDAYVGYSGGEFYAEPAGYEAVEAEHGAGYGVEVKMWLAPYDLGVSQVVRLESRPTSERTVYEITLALRRLSGDISSWKKANWFFLNTLRKQFLIWRTIVLEQRREYARRADDRLSAEVATTS
jgi:hypothetical protein